MKKIVFRLLFAALLPVSIANAQTKFDKGQVVDPEIRQLVKNVNEDSLRSYINFLEGFGTRHTMSSITDSKRGIGAARNWVLSKFRSFATTSTRKMEVLLQSQIVEPNGKRINRPIDLGNPIAILSGNDPSDHRIFVISAHLDSRASDVMNSEINAPGANDDGSGVAAVLECARLLSQIPLRATVVFVAFSGEEQSLLGSAIFAKKAKAEKWNIVGVLNNDMIGNTLAAETGLRNDKWVRVFSEGLPAGIDDTEAKRIRSLGLENEGNSRQLARAIQELGARYVKGLNVKLVYRNDRFLRGGDHSSLVAEGFPAVRITEYFENYDRQHQDCRSEKGRSYGDLKEYLDYAYLKKNVALNVATLASLAKAPLPPQKSSMIVKELTNSTELHWTASPSKGILGYEVLMRETDQSQWQFRYFTKEHKIKLPHSKDSFFFAVRSIDAFGNASLPSIPEVER